MIQVLTFKEISWQMIRIEADAIQSAEHEMLSSPIRLITNQSKIRVTLKRRVSRSHYNVLQLLSILLKGDFLYGIYNVHVLCVVFPISMPVQFH